MEERKRKEIEYYEKKAEEFLKEGEFEGDFEKFDPSVLASFRFLFDFFEKEGKEKTVLDYGCGNGVHTVWLAKKCKKVIGIDLSKTSLEIAKRRIKREHLENKAEFILMDCENMKFPDNYFDIIFDGGTFSSLDIDKALVEIWRVLKPGGYLVGIETLGHNPFFNLKRKINKIFGKRTEWAVEHIFKMSDLEKTEQYFERVECLFFHLISCLVFPFLKMPFGKKLLKIFEKIDSFLVKKFPFLKKYSFKIVFVFKKKIRVEKRPKKE